MTASVRSNGSTAHQNPLRNRHRVVCTTRSSGSLASMKLNGRRSGTGKCAQSPRDDQPCRPSLPRGNIGRAPSWAPEGISCIGPGEHPRGHPRQSFLLPQRQSRSRGGACFCGACPCRRLSVYTCIDSSDFDWRDASTGEHSRTHDDACTSVFPLLDALWAQA